MSKKRKNFHYHYAERYEAQEKRRNKRTNRRFVVSPVALIAAVVMLLLFGLVSTTFSVYVTNSFDDPNLPKSGGLIVSLRDSSHAHTGAAGLSAKADADLASTGAVTKIPAGTVLYLKVNDDWAQDSAYFTCKFYYYDNESGMYSDEPTTLVATGIYSVTVPANDYLGYVEFIRRNPNDNGQWNYSGKKYDPGNNNCVEITGWNNSSKWTTYTPETKYTVSVASGNATMGSVGSASVQVGSTPVTLPTATPAYGYKFVSWTTSDSTVSITNPTSANAATVTATGPGSVTANFAKNDSMNLYVAGRFHVRQSEGSNNWTNTFDSGDWSHTGDDNIKFVWDSTLQKYKVETYASLSELSTNFNINNNSYPPYFFVYDKDQEMSWFAPSSTTFTLSNRSVTMTDSGGANDRLRFNDTSTDKPVTLYFDATSKTLSYSVPDFYNVAIGSISNGSVSSDIARTTAGNTVTLTVVPNTGYHIGTVSYRYNNVDHTITPSAGGVYSFTMPSADVTVNATFDSVPEITSFTIGGQDSKTMNIADLATLNSTTVHSSNNVSYSVTASTPDDGSGNPVVSLSGRNVTALRPGTATITASLTGAESKTVTVTVNSPSLSFSNCSVEEMRSGTLTVQSSDPTPTGYSWAVKDTQAESDVDTISLSSSSTDSVSVNSLRPKSEDSTAKIILTATYSTNYSTTFEATVSITDSPIKLKGTMNGWTDEKMLYDSTTQLYKIEKWLDGSTKYSFGIDEGSTYYSIDTTIDKNNYTDYKTNTNGLEFTTVGSGQDCILQTEAEGTYTFYYKPGDNNHKFYVDGYPPVTYYLLGFGSWDKSESKKMTAGSGSTFTYTKSFTAGQSFAQGTGNGFKIWSNKNIYYGKDNTTVDYQNFGTEIQLDTGDGSGENLGFSAPYAGDYTFTFNPSTLRLSVTCPTRSLSVGAYRVENDSEKDLDQTVSLGGTLSSDLYNLTDNHNDTFDITIKDHDQYEFVSWENDTDDTDYTVPTLVSGNVYRVTLSSSDTSALVSAEWQYKGYNITFKTNGGVLSNHTVVTANDEYSGTYTHNTALTLPVPTYTENGYSYTFAGWYEPGEGGTVDYSGTPVTEIPASAVGDKTFYAKWTVRVEFRDNIRTTDSDLNANRITTQDVMKDSYATALTADDRTKADTALSTQGFAFSNQYSITLGSTQINAAWIASNDGNVIYAIYKPIVQPNFTVVITPSKDGRVTGTGTEQDNYIIKFGATIKVHAEIVKPSGVLDAIKYKWQAKVKNNADDASYVLVDEDYGTQTPPSDGKYTFERADIVPLLTHNANAGVYTLFARAYYTDARGVEVYTEEDHSYSIYYKINSPGLSVSPTQQLLQKIYTETNAPDLTFNITADTSITQTQEYVDLIKNFYKSGLFTYTNVYDAANQYSETDLLDITGTAPNFVSTFTFSDVPVGVSYFNFRLKRLSDVKDSSSALIYDDSPASDKIRTVVGTAQSSASRPLYVSNISENSVSNKRVMLFYVTSSNVLRYSTGTAFNHAADEDEVYRFDIPTDITKVSIGIFDPSKEYALPQLSGSSISYFRASSGEDPGFTTNYYAYTDWIDITASTQKISISGLSQGSQIASDKISTTSLLS